MREDYGVFISMKNAKKEFDVTSTATFMRFVHKMQIPYKKLGYKTIVFPANAFFAMLDKLKKDAERNVSGI